MYAKTDGMTYHTVLLEGGSPLSCPAKKKTTFALIVLSRSLVSNRSSADCSDLGKLGSPSKRGIRV